ncbi:MAG TPA: hypothetical protein VID70_11405 [Solirubrobacteraceae bacterium]|jgi:hypothetical protein
MIHVSIFTNEIRPDGELVDRLAAVFDVRGQELDIVAGNARFVQVGMPVYSERYGRLIDFDTDGEEWARNLPGAYRNGAMSVTTEEIVEAVPSPGRAFALGT